MGLVSNSHRTAGSGPLQPFPVSGHLTNDKTGIYLFISLSFFTCVCVEKLKALLLVGLILYFFILFSFSLY